MHLLGHHVHMKSWRCELSWDDIYILKLNTNTIVLNLVRGHVLNSLWKFIKLT